MEQALAIEKTRTHAPARQGAMPGLGVHQALEALNQRQWDQAAKQASAVLHERPSLPLAVLVLGIAQHHLGDPSSLATLARAVALAPVDAQFRYHYALTLAERGEAELAMVEYRACLDLSPDFREALWNYGEMLRLAGHFAAALDCFDRLGALEEEARLKLPHRAAVCCAQLGLDERADTLFRQALADPRDPGDPKTHWEYALFLLGKGRAREAWPHYARRFEAGKATSAFMTDFGFPDWRGRYESGATLVVQGEQSAGDEILFAAFLPELLRRAKAEGMRVVVSCRPALLRLFTASFPGALVLPPEAARNAVLLGRPGAGLWQLSMGDLPLWMDKPAPAAYLRPDPDDVVLMRLALANRPARGDAGSGLRIGLAWAAKSAVIVDRQSRNVPASLLNAFGSSLNASFFSLQTAAHRPALAHMADLRVSDMSDLLANFSRTAALMLEMDEVVTACTSTANLAGALGLPARVLLQKNADWRWHGDTAWYPHTRCYRQEMAGEWARPIQRLFCELSSPA
jgi:tetratricopeptide (TPR) repeat protein